MQPLTAESLVLHHLDNVDAKLWAFQKLAKEALEDGRAWSEYTYMFRRRMFAGFASFEPRSVLEAAAPLEEPHPLEAPVALAAPPPSDAPVPSVQDPAIEDPIEVG